MLLLDQLPRVPIEGTAIESMTGFTGTGWNGLGRGCIEITTGTDSLIGIGTATIIVVGTEGTSLTTTISMVGVTTEVTRRETSIVTGGEENAITFPLAMPISPRGRTTLEGEGWKVGAVVMVVGCMKAVVMVGEVVGDPAGVVEEGGAGGIHLQVQYMVSQIMSKVYSAYYFMLYCSGGGQGTGYMYQQQQQQQQAMQYYNQVPGVFYQPYSSSYSQAMYFNGPILPVDQDTLQDYIRKQM